MHPAHYPPYCGLTKTQHAGFAQLLARLQSTTARAGVKVYKPTTPGAWPCLLRYIAWLRLVALARQRRQELALAACGGGWQGSAGAW